MGENPVSQFVQAGAQKLRIAVDIGGTFTDGVAHAQIRRLRLGRQDADHAGRPGGRGVRSHRQSCWNKARAAGTAACVLDEVVHGTTLVTNTLIERKGVETALVTTQGMGDALDLSAAGNDATTCVRPGAGAASPGR